MPDDPAADSSDSTTTTSSGTCLCFDYGSKRIGTAVGESSLQSSRPLQLVRNVNGTPDWQAIDTLVEQWQPTDLIVGWPLNEAGEEQTITSHVRGFVKRLKQRYPMPVHLCDERFSSSAAQDVIRQQRRSGQRKRRSRHADVDLVAAALILESWYSMRD